MARVFLLDGTALAFRSHFAFARMGLTTADGQPTGATYGFTMVLRRILKEGNPDRIAIAFDHKGKTFRHEQYPEYKATRDRAPEEMIAQGPWIRDVVRAHGISIFEVPGFEADDVIGTLASEAEAAGDEVFIVTGDKDFMQLVSDRVKLWNVFKAGEDLLIQDVEAVAEKFGTTPDHVIDVLAIMGDSSDNVPGVKGIGEKGAIKLIEKYGTVDGVLEHLDELTPKLREKIEADRENLTLSRELVTIDTHVPLDPGLEVVGPAEPDAEILAELFGKLEFKSLLADLGGNAPKVEQERDYVTIRNLDELASMEAELRELGKFAVDTETTGLKPLEVDIVGASFSGQAGRAFYVPFNLDPPVDPDGPASLLKRLEGLLTDPQLERCAQNAKYDWLVFAGKGVHCPPPDFDTMVASFSIAGSTRAHNLDSLSLHYFNLRKIPTKELIGTGAKQITMAEVPVDTVAEYACEDADSTWRLVEVLDPELDEAGARELFEGLEMPLVPTLIEMEFNGIALNTEMLQVFGKELTADIDRLESKIHDLAGEVFNVNSTKVLGTILFEKLRIQDAAGVKNPKKTKTGYSTDAATLQQSYEGVEIVEVLLEYRELSKLRSTYVEALPRYVNPNTGRVHCSFSQVAAATGRLASSDPNLQNIPVRTEKGRKLRQAFVPRGPKGETDWVYLAADYSQIELRVMAHLSGDALMRQAFVEGQDIHASTASIIFDVEPDKVDRTMRSRAKVINFGLLYGMGPQRLARENDMTVPEAKAFIERYFESFPTVRDWMDRVLAEAREKGYVETLLGRRRRIPDIDSKNPRQRSFAENAAINTPVQGSAADIIKRAMIDVHAALKASELSARMLLQVHDELLFECPKSEVEALSELVRTGMQNAVALDVPLLVDIGTGANWLEAH
ncbi:DNA polymerase I [Engelhardtia mirabilis]|uniref:DNA polymerase I n=1 Tax=Engelhardtia mirabilis TaxID=2528011 RepID=A0A518BIF3_9BACT|nr:DNA polymerase I [Planctomycetes bacterium Pla133]QDV01072.1 DNA polymerase I [Planctomycetes bacterium Pla86]